MIQPIAVIEIKGVPELLNKLDAIKRPATIKAGMDNAAMNLVRWIRQNRLTGPRPQFLGVRTGRLRSSITFAPTEQRGGMFTTRIGTNVEYARIHELGFRGTIHVPGHTRRIFSKLSVVRISKKTGKEYKTKKTFKTGFTMVEPYGFMRNYAGRPFMRPALEDSNNRQMILDEITVSIDRALKKEKK